MQNIRLSINLLQLKGSRVVRMNDQNNTPQVYVAIPVSSCFVPKDKPEPRLMLTAIHTPNAPFGNFMIKPYLSPDDYKLLSKEEQQNLPIVGKGTFMEPVQNKELMQNAETVEAADVTIPAASSEPAANGSAAPHETAPFPSEASSPATQPSRLNPVTRFFVVDGNHNALHEADNFNEAAAEASGNFQAAAIEAWQGNTRVGRWTYDTTNFSWNQVV